jgi:uncharacterized protein YciI
MANVQRSEEDGAQLMHFVVLATDRPGSVELRERTRPMHRRYLRSPGEHRVRVLLAGPTLQTSDQTMNGTLLVVEAGSREEVARFIAQDPYTQAGLFEQVDIRLWKCGLGHYQASDETVVPVSD